MQGPGPDSRIVYIDGAFDLFHAGHVEVNVNSFPHAHPPENGERKKEILTSVSAKSVLGHKCPCWLYFCFCKEKTKINPA
jgi:hypothetical protein